MTKDLTLADELERLAKEATPGEWLHAGGLIYSLRQSGWRRGQPVMVNDITIRVESSSSDPEPIVQRILSALRGEEWQGIETRSEADDLLTTLSAKTRLSLQAVESDYEGEPMEWAVYRESGGRSDREFTLVARAATPLAALRAALPPPPKGQTDE